MITELRRANQFVGAEEYWAWRGICDGLCPALKNNFDPYESAAQAPLPQLEITKRCQQCYLNGFFLGVEIIESDEEITC